MFHELAHHFLHPGIELNAIEPFGANNSHKEFEADAFSILAIYPREALASYDAREGERYDHFLRHLRKQREKIHFLYGV